jgi:hypothetical protein
MTNEIQPTELSEEERIAFESFRRKYIVMHPIPKTFSYTLTWREGGLLFRGKVVTTVAAVLLAGFRTAEQFYLAASQSAPWLGWAEAFLAILSIEGLILFLAADKAKKRGTIHEFWSSVGILFALAISVLAGLGQSMRLVINLDQATAGMFTLVLAIGLGFASIVAYIGGEILGQELARIDGLNQKSTNEQAGADRIYSDRLNKAWDRSLERKMLYGKLSSTGKDFRSLSVSFKDWREVPHAERLQIASMTIPEIREEYGLEQRTAYNWKVQADAYAEKALQAQVFGNDK